MSPVHDSTIAANGKSVRENFLDWFGQSKVRHPDGSPRVVYRGEHGEPGVLRTALASIAFAADPAVASGYAEDPNDPKIAEHAVEPRVMPVYLNIQNPIIKVSRPWVDPDDLRAKLGADLADYFMKKYDYSGGYCFGKVEAFYLLDHAEFVQAARDRGFDGALYWGPYREGDDVEEFRVFDPLQVKSALGNSGLYLKNSLCLTDQAEHKALAQANLARRLAIGATPKDCSWIDGAQDVAGDMDALEAVSGDAPYILEQEDFDGDVAWIKAQVPLASIEVGHCMETQDQREERLQVIRRVPPADLFLPILNLDAKRRLSVIDGGHRLAVAAERGQISLSALVKCPKKLLAALRDEIKKSPSRLAP